MFIPLNKYCGSLFSHIYESLSFTNISFTIFNWLVFKDCPSIHFQIHSWPCLFCLPCFQNIYIKFLWKIHMYLTSFPGASHVIKLYILQSLFKCILLVNPFKFVYLWVKVPSFSVDLKITQQSRKWLKVAWLLSMCKMKTCNSGVLRKGVK